VWGLPLELEQAIRTRRTHKAFASQPVDRETLDELFELARWAPNHHLSNPWRFRVIGAQTRERLRQLAEAAKPGSAAKLDRAPTLVVVSAQAASEAPQDREDLLAGAVAAYLVLLAAHGRGLAGYWRTLSLLDEPACRALLEIEASEQVLGLLNLGYPRQEQRVPARTPTAEVVSYLP
jgi:nitroreductase